MVEVVNGVLGGRYDVIASLDDEEGRPDPTGRRQEIRRYLVGHGLIRAEPEALLEILEVLRVGRLEPRDVGAQGLDPGHIGRSPERVDAVVECENLVGVVGVGRSARFELFDARRVAIGAELGQHQVVLDLYGALPASHHARAHIGCEQLRLALDHADRDDRAPGVA